MRWGGALVMMAACGRIDFATVAGRDAATGATADAATQGDLVAAVPCETDLPLATVPTADEMQWLVTPSLTAIAVLHHVDNTHHEIRVYTLALRAGAVVALPPQTLYATPDMIGMQVVATPAGYAAFATPVGTLRTNVVALDPSFAAQPAHDLGDLGGASIPFAPGAAIGHSASYALELQHVDAEGATLGAAVEVMPATEGAARPSIVAAGTGFVVAWESGATGHCRFAQLDAAGAVIAGPLDIAAPTAAACRHPLVAPIDAATYAYTIEDGSPAYQLYAGAFDAALATATPPIGIGAPDSTAQGLLPGNPALVAVRTQGDSRLAEVLPSGGATVRGADFGLAGTDIDSAAIAPIANALVHARSETGELVIRRLCR